MIIKKYNILPDEAKYIRETVFIKEQGFKDEFDSIDDNCIHLVMFDDAHPVATCRVFFDENKGSYILGRLAVLPQYRGRNLGADMVHDAQNVIESMGGSSLMLHAQCRAKSFYEKQGYAPFGDVDYDEDCPHIWMKKVF